MMSSVKLISMGAALHRRSSVALARACLLCSIALSMCYMKCLVRIQLTVASDGPRTKLGEVHVLAGHRKPSSLALHLLCSLAIHRGDKVKTLERKLEYLRREDELIREEELEAEALLGPDSPSILPGQVGTLIPKPDIQPLNHHHVQCLGSWKPGRYLGPTHPPSCPARWGRYFLSFLRLRARILVTRA